MNKYTFQLSFESPDFVLKKDRFQSSLPSNFTIREEQDGIYIDVESDISAEEVQNDVYREMDRHFFLTNVRIKASMVNSMVRITTTINWEIQGPLPQNVAPQEWNNPNLPIQLRLWKLARDSKDIILKVIFFYQIIELSGLDIEPYKDSEPPTPLTECKLIRNFIAHPGEVANKNGTINYCKYLERNPPMMFQPTVDSDLSLIKSKLPLLEGEAKKIIDASISKTIEPNLS